MKVVFLLASAQTADVALIPVARPSSLSEARSSQVAAELGDVLRGAGLVVVPARPALPQALSIKDGRSAGSEVVAYSGSLLDATIALRIEAGELGDQMILALEALDSNTGAKVTSQTLTTQTAGDHASWKTDLAPLITALKAEAARRPVKVVAAPLPVEAPPKIVERIVETPSVPRTVFLAPIALGAVMLGASTFAFVASRQRHDALSNPSSPRLSTDESKRVALEGQSLQSLAVAGFIVGTLAVASGAALWITSVPSADSPSVALAAGPGQVTIEGSF